MLTGLDETDEIDVQCGSKLVPGCIQEEVQKY